MNSNILRLTKAHLMPFLLGADSSQQTMNAAIDPLTSQTCNVHLTIILLDRVLVALFPELVGGNSTIAGSNTPTNGQLMLLSPHITHPDARHSGEISSSSNGDHNHNNSTGSFIPTVRENGGDHADAVGGSEIRSGTPPSPTTPALVGSNSDSGGGVDDR